jgi:hypothetical protein
METLLPFVLPAVLFLALELLWCRPSWLHPRSDGRGRREQRAGVPPPPPVDWDPFSLPFVQQRLVALAAELDQLARARDVFALGFRTRVAQAAYDALLADAARLTEAARRDAYRAGTYPAITAIELELPRTLVPLREELEF